MASPRRLRFQSPSRRGRHFYYRSQHMSLVASRISVPFAKGTPLLRQRGRLFERKDSQFQSPSRRGRHFYSSRPPMKYPRIPYFSPLREGDATSTNGWPTSYNNFANFSPLREGDATSTPSNPCLPRLTS